MKVKCFGSLFRASVFSFISIVAIVCQAPVVLAAETDTATKKSIIKKVEFSGSLGFDQNFFSYESNDSTFVASRPRSQTILMASASISYGRFSLPFSFSYVVAEKTPEFVTPIPNKFSLQDLLNNYNTISVNPTFKNLQINLGTHVPQYSELTSGDLPLFGTGFYWKPKKLRIGAFYGISQRGINTDTLNAVPGSYQRMSGGIKLGFGSEEGSHIYAVVLNHKDDPNSALVTTQGIYSQENLVSSLDMRLKLSKKLFLQTEIAGSLLSTDRNDPSLESDSFELNLPNWFKDAFTLRTSSSVGAATSAAFGYTGEKWGFKTSGKFYSSDYRTLNFPFLQTDRLEWLVEPYFTIFKGHVSLNGSIGRWVDNLLRNKNATAYQTIGSLNANIKLSSNLTLSGSYSNFGMRNTVANDTFRLQNINENISISTSYNISKDKAVHAFLLAFNRSSFDDLNLLSGVFADNTTEVYLFSYSLSLANKPLSITLSDSYMQNELYLGDLKLNTATAGINYQFGKEKNLNTGILGNYLSTFLDENSPDQSFSLSFIASQTLWKKLNLSFNGTYNLFSYGSNRPGITYNENSIRIAANYSF